MASIIFRIPKRYGKRRGPKKAEHNAYNQRDGVLFRMGFASYSDYLKSPEWKAIRGAKLTVDPLCEVCGDKAQQVHHLAYTRSVLSGKARHKLLSVCEGCHKKIEFTEDGSKRSFEGAYKKAKRMLKKIGGWVKHTKRGSKQQ